MTLLEALAKKSEAPIEIISGVAVGRKFRWHRGHIQTQTATSEFWNDCTNISALILARADKVKIKGNNMVEKLDIDYDSPCRLRQEHGQKINEIIDDLHELKALYKEHDKLFKACVESINVHERQIDKLQMMLEPIKCEPCPENVQDEIDKAKREGRVLFPDPADVATALTKTLRMDKEFAEYECVRLQDELGRTKKALDYCIERFKSLENVLDEKAEASDIPDNPDLYAWAARIKPIWLELKEITGIDYTKGGNNE